MAARWAVVLAVAALVAGCNSSTVTPPPSGSVASPAAIALASPAATPARTPAPEPPSAADLIRADVAAGKIDEPTGLLYRIEAMYGAPGLPAQYASAPAGEDEAAVVSATLKLDSLPAAIHDQILPFLVRPTDPRSAFHGSGASPTLHDPAGLAAVRLPAGLGDPAEADVTCGSDGWASVSSERQPITVWGECGQGQNDADLTTALAGIESVYNQEIVVMGPPLPDEGTADAGGSPNIDIYLSTSCVTRGGVCHSVGGDLGIAPPAPKWIIANGIRKGSGYIVINRADASAARLKDVAAHEMFHVLEFAHNIDGMLQGDDYYWMVEASAEWAEEQFVPEGRAQFVYPDFNSFETTGLGLTSTASTNEYSSFIWPYYIAQEQRATAVGSAWKAFENVKGWDALNAKLSGILSFQSKFKEFAVRAWNTDLPDGGSPDLIAPRFQEGIDASMPKTGPAGGSKYFGDIPLARKASDPPVKVPETMPPLSARYAELDLTKDLQQLIVDFSGLAPTSALDVVALVHNTGGQWERKDLPAGKTTFCLSKQPIDRVLFVLADHGYTSGDFINGKWQYQALSDACSPGSFKVTVANVGNWNYEGPGTYSGDTPVDCHYYNGAWTADLHDPGTTGVDHVWMVTIDQHAPQSVTVDTTFLTEGRQWQVMGNGTGATVQITVQDTGKAVTITAHGVAVYLGNGETVDATLECATILRD